MADFPQFKGKRVLVFGLGLNDGGLGMVDFFVAQGAKVTITDGKTAEQLATALEKLKLYGDSITYHLGGHLESDFTDNDIIIRNPAIKPDNPFLEIARKAGKPIEMEMSLFMRLAPCKIIGISGTRGKSTTTTLTYLFLKQKYGDKVVLAGNIGKSAIRELPSLTADHLVVLEISSFQLDAMREAKQSPHIALLTNIFQDHLNWHKDLNDYIDCKYALFSNQSPNDIAIVNIDDPRAAAALPIIEKTKATLITFSSKDSSATFSRKNYSVRQNGKEILSLENMLIDGEHNYYNALGAIALATQLGVTPDQILAVLTTFTGVEGRQQFIRTINGIQFCNDTTATSLEAMIAALERFGPQFSHKIVMISGGVDKGFEYENIAPLFKQYLKALVLLDGTASEKIAKVAATNNIESYGNYAVFKEAIDKAFSVAQNGDLVILCPGAASFNMFANEFDRGKQFNDLVQAL